MTVPMRARWIIAGLAAGGLAVMAGAAILLYGGDAPAPAERGGASLVARGAQVYQEHCAACHGADLGGQPNWRARRPDGKLPAPPHDESGHTWHHPDDQLFGITKYGTARFAPPGYETDMIGFGDVLSDEEIWAVLTFIKSHWPPRARAVQAERTRQSRVN